jgi:outer membrane protein assembly factor BamD
MLSQPRVFIAFSSFILSCVFLAALTGCASTTANPDDPEALYKEAEEALQDEHYLVALERYRDVKNRFPYSSRAVDSELRIADAYFAQESYLEAEAAYEIFRELHPTHPRSDYVQFRIGLSYFNQIPDHSGRDLSAAYRAIDAFNIVLDKYKSSSLQAEAKQRIAEARAKLAHYQNYVADFYYQRRHYLSASYRYAGLLQDYSDLGYDEEALYRLGESYYHIRMFSNARETLKRLLAKYPETEHKAGSQALLKELEKTNP